MRDMTETVAYYPAFVQPNQSGDRFHIFSNYSLATYNNRPLAMDQIDLSSGQRWQNAEIKLELSGPGEHIKHRRTRSGCFTCRARRVKCDETRPICERCAKGGRQCTFPDPTATPKSTRTRRKQPNTPSTFPQFEDKSPSPEDLDSDICFSDTYPADIRFLSACPPDSSNPGQSAPGSIRSQRSLSPAMYNNDGYPDLVAQPANQRGSHAPDVAFWLDYHRKHITFQHYLLKSDESDFFSESLLSYAIRNEALLYSVVAFASFHYFLSEDHSAATWETDQKSVETFFEYHNRAIVSLRESFQENLPPDVFTLLTVLQLATLEEYLGDWANLIEHRKGAYMILESLFSPQSILDTSEGYPIFSWFTRIDLGVSMISGLQTILDPEWYDTACKTYQPEFAQQSDSTSWTFMNAEAHCRYISMQVVNLLYARFNGLCDYGSYESGMLLASKDIDTFWEKYSDLESHIGLKGSDDSKFSSPYIPRMAYIYAEIHALSMLIHHQRSVLHGYDKDYMSTHCSAIYDLVRMVTGGTWHQPALLLPFQLSLAMAAAFAPDENVRMFLRLQFHEIEQAGFLYPIPFKSLLSKLWDDRSIRFEWLPENSDTRARNASSMNILSAMRALAEDRNKEMDVSNNPQRSQLMRNLFSFADLQG
ncbi:hypothetical protein Dda_6479 [Drechslerella dactyloides]|uniref:Zn(2)-C6 fungal-type domain-containing protein n=1 Tax=Drechslerella dactyloides TaxID=74499 RepID=A0AAD6IUV0_DREDA|nr:hypothetical protein Dda_6479 [Drechslerella dactyloides]